MSFCNGGHNLPYIHRASGEVEEIKDVGGLLLGKFENALYDEGKVQLQPGDTILTFTDGITEAESETTEYFDEIRVTQYLSNNPSKSLTSLVKGLFLEVMKFAGAADQSDDITVLAIRHEKANE